MSSLRRTLNTEKGRDERVRDEHIKSMYYTPGMVPGPSELAIHFKNLMLYDISILFAKGETEARSH